MRTRYTATIGFRILLAFFCIFVILIIQGSVGIYRSRKAVELQRHAYTSQRDLMQFRHKLSFLRIRMFTFLGTLDPTKMETLKAEIEQLFEEISKDSQTLNIQDEIFASSQQTYRDIMALHWDFQTVQAYELINSTSEEEYESLYETLETLSREIETTMQETIRQTNRQLTSLAAFFSLVELLILILWGWYLIRSIAGPIKQAVRSAQMIADGDLSMTIAVRRKDETGQLLTAFNTMIARLKAMSAEIETLIQAIQAGRLDHRGDAQAFAGGWRDLVQGINTVVDAFVTPITMTAQSIDRIAKGEILDPITETYQGDFNTIKDNLNSLIAATQDITQVAEALAAGNLEIEVHERSDQDTLMQALNAMVQRLREVVRHVKSATKNVAIGSSELIFSAKQMSDGASEQAAATQEASSSLEEMAANIRQNAENAIQTEKMAKRTANDAEEGGQAVTQTVAAMKEIVEKILIIQEIAQETRMLSLNATIEAARASEHGKAFSTVAAEIRQLADTTKKSAEAIKHLSDSSVGIAERSGAMLAKMVPNSQKTAELVQEISAASNEQSMGVNQVNKAIYQLDQVTQQNASLAEEVAAMAEKLADQSIHLQSAVEFFTLAETTLQEEEEAAHSETTSVEPGGRETHRESPQSEKTSHHAVGRNNLKQDRTSPRDTNMHQMERDDVEEQDDVNDAHDADFERY
jgi:methyl-accepting chemotaxis protein